jgi:uncharacterized protein (DUF427 family)
MMTTPGPDPSIEIEPNPKRVLVRFGGRVLADTTKALTLREGQLAAVQYVPRADVDMSLLVRTEHTSHCPSKGDAAYYSIHVLDHKAKNAVWTYEAAYPAVAAIENHLAFYADRVDAIEERDAAASTARRT